MANTVPIETQQSSVLAEYRAFLLSASHSPATWLFIGLYILATSYLTISEHISFILISLLALLCLALCIVVVLPLTRERPVPSWEEPSRRALGKLRWQYSFFIFYSILLVSLPPFLTASIPIHLIGILIFLLAEFLPPLGLAFLLGARWSELGFGQGYHTWRVTGILLIIPVILFVVGIVSSKNYALTTLLYPFTYVFLIGIPEEIGFRGVLTTRCIRLFGTQWGVALASLLFGLVHITSNLGYFHVSILGSVAFCIAFQAPVGLALALILQRTRNLVAGILFHGFFDAACFVWLPLLLPFFLKH